MPADAPAVADALWLARVEAFPAVPAFVHSRESVGWWVEEVLLPTHEVTVAETNPRPVELVGVLAVHHTERLGPEGESGDRGELAQLYLRSAWTGRGLGGQLVELAQRSCPAGLELWVFQSNPAAISFYERHGFVRGRTTDGDNEEGEPDLQMRWRPQAPSAASLSRG